MNLATITKLSISRILATKTRSFLTMLGVIIGVASLVALTSVASGATSGITDSLSSLGATQVTVTSTSATDLTEADAEAISELDDVDAVSASVSGQGTLEHEGTTAEATLNGVSPDYAETNAPEVAVGSFLPAFSGSSATRSLVLGASAANDLGVEAESIGATVSVNGLPFTLVGVLDDASGFGGGANVYMSLEAARGLFAQLPYVSTITVQAASEESVDGVQSAIDTLLRERNGLSADDDAQFSINNQSSLLESIDSVQSLLSILLGGIASISLVVGGIGIMNIMLVSVRERTREIGVRRAIGARRGQILLQFLIEATVLSLLGGIIGLGLGIVVSALIANIAGWAFTVSATTVLIALAFSAVVGIVFGVWPARTASRLQPVEALRYE
ncbi:ABC transporter permease [Microbacterium sp. HJ5]